jgi:YD repeat-containing protein
LDGSKITFDYGSGTVTESEYDEYGGLSAHTLYLLNGNGLADSSYSLITSDFSASKYFYDGAGHLVKQR